MLEPLNLRALYPVYEEVHWNLTAREEINVWLLKEIKLAVKLADRLLDTARDMDDLQRASGARKEANTALNEWINHHQSAAIAGLTRAWYQLDPTKDQIDRMKVRLLGFLPVVDALAFLARQENT